MKKYLTPEIISEKLIIADVMTASGGNLDPALNVNENEKTAFRSVFNWNG